MDDTADVLAELVELQSLIDADEAKVKSWPCGNSNCGNLNPAFRARCNRCGTIRSTNSPQRTDAFGLEWMQGNGGAAVRLGAVRTGEHEQCPICLTDMNEDANTEGKPDGWAELIDAWRDTWITFLCGHRICSPCFIRYVEQYSRGAITVQSIPHRGQAAALQTRNIRRYLCCLRCPQEVGQEVVRANASATVYADYLRATVRVALAGFGPLVTRCPGTNCDNALLAIDSPGDKCVVPVACVCGITFCGGCGERWEDRHAILSCERFRLSTQTLDEVRVERWKERETKACPGCRVPINKNEGCSHMTCRWCAHEFCWNCNGDYSFAHACVPMLPAVLARPLLPPRRRQPRQWWHDDPDGLWIASRDGARSEDEDDAPRPPKYRTPRERYGVNRPHLGPSAVVPHPEIARAREAITQNRWDRTPVGQVQQTAVHITPPTSERPWDRNADQWTRVPPPPGYVPPDRRNVAPLEQGTSADRQAHGTQYPTRPAARLEFLTRKSWQPARSETPRPAAAAPPGSRWDTAPPVPDPPSYYSRWDSTPSLLRAPASRPATAPAPTPASATAPSSLRRRRWDDESAMAKEAQPRRAPKYAKQLLAAQREVLLHQEEIQRREHTGEEIQGHQVQFVTATARDSSQIEAEVRAEMEERPMWHRQRKERKERKRRQDMVEHLMGQLRGGSLYSRERSGLTITDNE